MFFPSFRLRRRRSRRHARQIEHLEPRQLLAVVTQLTPTEVTKLLDRASMATSSNDGIIAVVDRGGHILGVRVEQDVLDAIGNQDPLGVPNVIDPGTEESTLVYAIDGAVAKARTAAFFANGTADTRIVPDEAAPTGTITPSVGPLTSRTIRNISQSTITQREVESNPNIPIAGSRLRGPGFVAPIGIGQHFPPEIARGPQVDLFGIEHTNRDSIVHAGADSIRGNADDINLQQRFNIDPAFVPEGKTLDAPESYGFTSGRMPNAQARGIATLPGGVPIFRIFDPVTGGIVGLDVIGGIGVFFPGTTNSDGPNGFTRIGDATFEQNFPNAKTEGERTNAPKVLEAEYSALYAIGGGIFGGLTLAKDRIYGGDFPIPFGRVDLVGITLQIIGPTTGVSGVRTIANISNKPQSNVALATKINASVTTLTVNNATPLPADDNVAGTPDFTILINQEVLTVTDVVGNTLTVIRGQDGTAAKSHAAGKAVIANTVQLRAAIDADDLSVTVTDATVLPTAPFLIRIDKEVLQVTSVAGNTLTVVRAQNGSVAAKHAKGVQVAAGSGENQILKVTSSVAVTALSAAATTLNVPDASVFPPAPFSILIDAEEISVTSIDLPSNTLTIARAQNGTVAAAHAIGATIRTTADFTAIKGRVIEEGWLVTPHDSPMAGTPITEADVRRIIEQGIIVAGDTESRLTLTDGRTDDGRRVRAAIRLEVKIPNIATFDANNQRQVSRVLTNPGAAASMVLAVADADGNVLGLYRMHDSTIFSIDVAVAKARNTVYYAGPDLQTVDQVDDNDDGVADVPLGTAFTNRTFRFLAEPRFPQGVDGSQPGDFSILRENVGGVPLFQTEFLRSRRPKIAVQAAENNPVLGPAAASAFVTVFGFDSFNPGRNFRDLDNIANQNGIVFFPGSTPLYDGTTLIGGFGISGDGVDQDDVVTFYGAQGFLPSDAISSADDIRVRNTRLPYQKFNRNPFG